MGIRQSWLGKAKERHTAREEQAKGSISGAGQHELESPLRTARRNPDKQVRFLLSDRKLSHLLVVNLLICDALNDAVSNPDRPRLYGVGRYYDETGKDMKGDGSGVFNGLLTFAWLD